MKSASASQRARAMSTPLARRSAITLFRASSVSGGGIPLSRRAIQRRRRARPAEDDQADGGRRREAVRPVEGRGGALERGADAWARHGDAADRPADLPLLRAGDGE